LLRNFSLPIAVFSAAFLFFASAISQPSRVLLRSCETAYFLWKTQDYPKIIKRPMDLSTMEKKLRSGEYKSPWGYIDDFRLMLDNCATYNKKSTQVYKDSVTVRYEGLLCNRLETFIILNLPVFISFLVRAFLIGFRQRLVFFLLYYMSQLGELFDKHIDAIMTRMLFCCGKRVSFLASHIFEACL
jgi:hypothetical protein